MKERPIMFKAEMVRAILNGKKTQTRRPVKPSVKGCTVGAITHDERPDLTEAINIQDDGDPWTTIRCPYGVPGDRLWVKETWRPRVVHSHGQDACDCGDIDVTFAADGATKFVSDYTIAEVDFDWRMPRAAELGNVSPLFMPRWASRITLEIVSVFVERICAITANSSLAEGIAETPFWTPKELESRPFEEKWWDDFKFWSRYPQLAFSRGWDSMYGKTPFAWSKDPWVWVVEFRRV